MCFRKERGEWLPALAGHSVGVCVGHDSVIRMVTGPAVGPNAPAEYI